MEGDIITQAYKLTEHRIFFSKNFDIKKNATIYTHSRLCVCIFTSCVVLNVEFKNKNIEVGTNDYLYH